MERRKFLQGLGTIACSAAAHPLMSSVTFAGGPERLGENRLVVVIHGGCWQTSVAKADIMHALAADLMKRGIAVWNIEYRGVDVPGGGYPGTY